MISHVKEILEQNHESLTEYLDTDVGLYSAMLNKREIKDVTVAGIQSIFRNPEAFSQFNLVIVDEAHLVSAEENTMYQKFLAGIGKYICVGFTATPHRLGSGYIYGESDNSMFDDIVLDYSTGSKFNTLIEQGYLCKLTTKRTKMEMDTSNIKLVAGDFNEKQLSAEFDREIVTNAAIKEVIAAGVNREKWLIFAIDIDHAEHIAEVLIRNGVPTAPVHSKMKESGFCRHKTIEGYKNGKYKCIVNVNILTTGFDDPGIDMVVCLRPTHSPVLHIQSVGRGSRTNPGKDDCLVLDFAGNTARIGPINDPIIKIKGKGKEGGDPITKTCPECDSILAPAVRICPDCGFKFPISHGISPIASMDLIIDPGKPHWIDVGEVKYSKHTNFGHPSIFKATYLIGGTDISEWVCIEHKGFAKHKANHWVKYRGGEECNTVDELLKQSDKLRVPKKILVSKKGKHFVVRDSIFQL